MDIVKEFNEVRDIPYRIPLKLTEQDRCCTGKAKMLYEIFKRGGYGVRYRVCKTRWSDLNLPPEILAIPHDDESSHTYLEVSIDGTWKVVDATWDSKLRNIFHINEWDGRSNTAIAFPVRESLSPKRSLGFLKYILTPEAVLADLKVNSEFYKSFNEWLEKQR